MKLRTYLYSAAGLAALACASGAMAQAMPAPAGGQAEATEGGGLEVVVVTAEHRREDVQKSAISISVVSGSDLAKMGITSSKDLAGFIPGFDLSTTSPNANLSLRGLGAGGGNQYTDPVIALNIGGVPISLQYATTASMYDVARVELLKGPQGTLYGRNATVGALNIVPNQPVDRYEGSASVTVGNYGTVNTTGMVNMPLSDTLYSRVAFSTNHHTGYLTNGYDDANDQSGRVSLLYVPNDQLSVLLWADYYNNDSKGPSTIFRYVTPNQEFQVPSNPWFAWGPAGSCGNPAFCPSWGDGASQFHPGGDLIGIGAHNAALEARSVMGNDGYLKVSQQIYASQVDYHFSQMTFTFIPAYVVTDVKFHSYMSALDFTENTHAEQTSLEARLASDNNGPLKWQAGVFYFNEADSALNTNLEVGGYQIVDTPKLPVESIAGFGEATYSVTDRLRLTAGLRYTQDKKSQAGYTLLDAFFPGQFNSTNCPAAQGGVAVAGPTTYLNNSYPYGYCVVPNGGNVKEDSLSWKAGVEFDVAKQSLLYANVRTGYKAGGLAPGLPPNTYLPEKLTAYEIGSKNRFLDNRLQANLEVFYWDYKNQQIGLLRAINPAGQSSYPVNVPGYLEGAEMSLDAVVTDNDRVGLDLLYEKGKYYLYPTVIQVGGSLGGLKNYPRVNMPAWNGTVTYMHEFALSNSGLLDFNAEGHFETSTNMRPENSTVPGDKRPAFFKLDASLSYVSPDQKWTVSLYGKNLTDAVIYTVGASGTVGNGIFYHSSTNPLNMRYAGIGAPRTFGITVSTKFQ